MLKHVSALGPAVDTAQDAGHRNQMAWWRTYTLCLFGSLVVAVLAIRTAPGPFVLALVVFFIVLAIALLRPALGLFVVLFFAVLGDPQTSSWYPATKNFSSHESILYVNDRLILNPLEVCLGALLVGWLLQMMSTGRFTVRRGVLFRPLMVFVGFMTLGLVIGLAHGGNSIAAFWEFRALAYLPIVYVLLTNLFERRQQYVRLYWLIMTAVLINSVIALLFERTLSIPEKDGLETLVAHGATLPMNAMVVLVGACWLLHVKSAAYRLLLPLMAVPVVAVYLMSQRRAAVVALIAGLIILGLLLFWTRRRLFWKVAPVVLLIGTLYTAAFWHDETSLAGFPAQAVKSVVAPDEVSDRNQSSDLYRIVEKQDVLATIQSSPILGIGFGVPFLRPYPLPSINPFLLEPYMPHNSILWVWMKAGIGGFIAMLYLFGRSMRAGARAVLRAGGGSYGAITLTSTAFVLMYAVFAYVDIAWDAQNLVLLGVAMAQIAAVGMLREDRLADVVEPEEEADDPAGPVPRPARLVAVQNPILVTAAEVRDGQ
jgi:O-antigen ligase